MTAGERLAELAARLGVEAVEGDPYDDLTFSDSPGRMVAATTYDLPLTGDDAERDEVARRLFRLVLGVFDGGLERAVPDALTNGKELRAVLFMPTGDLTDETRALLSDFTAFFAEREIELAVVQAPASLVTGDRGGR